MCNTCSSGRVLSAALVLLQQQAQFLRGIPSNEIYSKVCSRNAASISQHMRHSLSHFDSCIAAARSSTGAGECKAVAQYDLRKRGCEIETDRMYAASKANAMSRELEELAFEEHVEVNIFFC